MSTLEDSELLTQGKIFEQQVATSEKQTGNCAETEPDDGEHDSDITEKREGVLRRKFLIPKPSRVLARNRDNMDGKTVFRAMFLQMRIPCKPAGLDFGGDGSANPSVSIWLPRLR